MHFLIILKKFASTSTQVSQVSGFVDRRWCHGHRVPWTPGFFLMESRYISSIRTTFTCKCRWALNSNYCRSYRSDARDAT
jgi:hypothetical protein